MSFPECTTNKAVNLEDGHADAQTVSLPWTLLPPMDTSVFPLRQCFTQLSYIQWKPGVEESAGESLLCLLILKIFIRRQKS